MSCGVQKAACKEQSIRGRRNGACKEKRKPYSRPSIQGIPLLVCIIVISECSSLFVRSPQADTCPQMAHPLVRSGKGMSYVRVGWAKETGANGTKAWNAAKACLVRVRSG